MLPPLFKPVVLVVASDIVERSSVLLLPFSLMPVSLG
jgi:hypothetical protein